MLEDEKKAAETISASSTSTIQELKKKIEDFRENLPLIKCIMSEAIHQEDWEEIKTVTKKPELERDTLTVNKFKEEGLMDFLPDIEDITTRAEKKFQLTKFFVIEACPVLIINSEMDLTVMRRKTPDSLG